MLLTLMLAIAIANSIQLDCYVLECVTKWQLPGLGYITSNGRGSWAVVGNAAAIKMSANIPRGRLSAHYTYVCINPIKSQVTQCDKSRCLLF